MNSEKRGPRLGVEGLASAAQRRTYRNDLADKVGPLASEGTTNQSAQTVAYNNYSVPGILRNLLQPQVHTLDLALWTSDIKIDS